MTRTKSSATNVFIIVVALLSLGHLSAQTLPAQGAPPQGRTGDWIPDQLLDMTTASKLVAAAQVAAAAKNQHIAVCVMDARGYMAAFGRMDNVNITPVTTAIGKAHTVLVFGVPTRVIAEAISSGKPVSVTIKALQPGQDNLTFLRGGLPIIKDGKMIGAIGVGGTTGEEDERIAQSAINAVMGNTQR